MTFLLEIIRLGLHNLRLHMLRTVLTSLGIILGVAAVILMVAIGEGNKQAALREIERANPETLYRVFGAADWGNRDMLTDGIPKDLIEVASSDLPPESSGPRRSRCSAWAGSSKVGKSYLMSPVDPPLYKRFLPLPESRSVLSAGTADIFLHDALRVFIMCLGELWRQSIELNLPLFLFSIDGPYLYRI